MAYNYCEDFVRFLWTVFESNKSKFHPFVELFWLSFSDSPDNYDTTHAGTPLGVEILC